MNSRILNQMKLNHKQQRSRQICALLSAGTLSLTGLTLCATYVYGAEVSGIDAARTVSITIHKYDITSAEKTGAYSTGMIQATGQSDLEVESALKGYEIEGVEFSYAKVGDMETYQKTSKGSGEIVPVFELSDQLVEILELDPNSAVNMKEADHPCSKTGVYHFRGEQVQEAMAAILKNDNTKAKNAMERYVQTASSSGTMTKTDANGVTSVSGLAQGLYLIAETGVPEMVTETVDPWLAQLPFTDSTGTKWVYDLECYPKNQTGNPTLDKSVRSVDDMDENTYEDTATASEGDILEYLLVSKLPHISSEATYLTEYTFRDTLSKGLAYNKDAKIYFYHTAEDAASNKTAAADESWEQADGYFTAAFTENSAEQKASMTVKLTEKGIAAANKKSDAYIVVSYTAEMTSGAETVLGDEGNPNDVQLIWRRTSDSYYDTLEDRSYVYTYGLKLTKEFADGNGDFSKVKFQLYNSTDKCFVIAEKAGDGSYLVKGNTKASAEATVFVPNGTNGLLTISGMEGDLYKVTELETDSGYSLLHSPITLEIKPTKCSIQPAVITENGKNEMMLLALEAAKAFVDGTLEEMTEGHAFAVLSVINSSSFRLPQTGGNGLYVVTVIGVLIAAAGFGLTGKKKKDA